MVQWALTHTPPTPDPAPSILEVGSGNGNLLFALACAGYPPSRLAGIDYSPDAVALSSSVAESRGVEFKEIVFAEADFLDERERRTGMPRVSGMRAGEGWDVVMDKGTYDAIALSENVDANGDRVYRRYPLRIAEILKPGGYFLITCESAHVRYAGPLRSSSQTSVQLQQRRAAASICNSRNEARVLVSHTQPIYDLTIAYIRYQ